MTIPTTVPGQRLGRFLLIEQIGAGGMGVVFRARDENLQRDVAIKVLPPGVLGDEQARKRFRNEALSLSRLNHPHIAAVYDFDTANGVDFLVLELVGGESLDAKVRHQGLQERDVLRLGAQMADALDAAHRQGVVHRDLKPANLRLTSDGELKVLDFGLAQSAPSAAGLAEMNTQSSTSTAGTVPYMAPEQLRGEQIDARSDIWAAGCVLYEMASGRPPFDGGSSADLVVNILQKAPAPPSSRTSHLSPRLQDVILKCLEKDPDARYQSARELGIDLRRLASGSTVPLPVSRSQPPWRLIAAIAAVVVLLSAAGAWLLNRPKVRAGEIQAIAVLPLVNLTGNAENDYFADGMTEALITNLSKVGALRVISRTSIMRYRGSSKALPEIARELNVQAVVEGSVQRAGDRVRITTQLVRADPEVNLWADDYEGEIRDVLTLQRNVAEAVVRQIQVKLTAEDRSRLSPAAPVNPKAYESFLRGRLLIARVNPAAAREATQHFNDAVAIDPQYAAPYAGLAEIEVFSLPASEHMPKAKAAAEKALRLDPNNAEAYMALGLYHLYYDWDYAGAQSDFAKAIALNPGSAVVYARSMIPLWAVGKFDEAIRAGEKARQLDPFSVAVNVDLGRSYYFAKRYDEAIRQFQKTLELDNNNGLTYLFMGVTYGEKGMFVEASQSIARYMEIGGFPDVAARMRSEFTSSGYPGSLKVWADHYEKRAKEGKSQSWSVAIVYARMGKKDKAFEWLQRAADERNRAVVLTKADPQVDSLRSDPRFAAFLKRIGLE
ncbi:MAG TPA: protein kinase [Terriglobales bacterium]|nr:protein kinase [Terriglobales bacterium]